MHTQDVSLTDARALIARAIDKAAHVGVRGAVAVVGASGGISASGATVGPFVNIPGIDRRMLIAEGKPANSEDLLVLWALGLPYEGQHGDDEKRWLDAFGELPAEAGLGYSDPPPADQPEYAWAVGLADQAISEAAARGVRVAVAIVDHRGDPIQQDTMDGTPTAAPFVAEAVAAGAASFGLPSHEVEPAMTTVLPYRALPVPGGLPIRDGDRIVAGLGIAGPRAPVCHEIAGAVLA